VERRPFDELKDERPNVTTLFETVDLRHVLVVQGGENLCLPLKAGEAFWIGGKGVWQDLERHVAVQGRVPGLVHLAHLTRADGGEDFVDAERGAGGQSHQSSLPPSIPLTGA
jgi:hypothetical protein